MSWSFNAIGKPEAVIRALDTANAGLTGQSKDEWEEAKPALKVLVGANLGGVAVKIAANGQGYVENGVKTQGQCSVAIDTIYGFVE